MTIFHSTHRVYGQLFFLLVLNSFLTSSKMNYGLFPTIFCPDDSEANMAASEKPALCG